MVVTLLTARLILRAPVDGDVDAIFRACQDRDIQRFTTIPVPYARADAEHFVGVVAPARRARVMETVDGDFVGCIGVETTDGNDVGSVGYWCAPGQRGHGYTTEALHAVLDEALRDDGLGLPLVTWEALEANTASARIARRVGFRYRGRSTIRLRGRDEPALRARLCASDDRVPQVWPEALA